MNIVIGTDTTSYCVMCSDEDQTALVLRECEEDGHQYRYATDADCSLEKVEFLDWNPA